MKTCVILVITLLSAQAFALKNKKLAGTSHVEMVTGVKYFSGINCSEIHNVKSVCYQEDMDFVDCKKGSESEHNSHSVVAICDSSQKPQVPLSCRASAKKFLTPYGTCKITNSKWNAISACIGDDLKRSRETLCPLGCENVPKYHVCDWSAEQYKNFQNCSSVSNLLKQTRTNLCPNGRDDVDSDGPPPRINVVGDRYPSEDNYLTFDADFKIEIGSITNDDVSFCIQPKDSKECRFQKITMANKEGTKFILDGTDSIFPEGNFTLKIKNNSNKKLAEVYLTKKTSSFMRNKAKTGSFRTNIPRSIANGVVKGETKGELIVNGNICRPGIGLWTELIGPELSPVVKNGNRISYDYYGKDCNCLGLEEKDSIGRRWKCTEVPSIIIQPAEVIAEVEEEESDLPENQVMIHVSDFKFPANQCLNISGRYCDARNTRQYYTWNCNCGKNPSILEGVGQAIEDINGCQIIKTTKRCLPIDTVTQSQTSFQFILRDCRDNNIDVQKCLNDNGIFQNDTRSQITSWDQMIDTGTELIFESINQTPKNYEEVKRSANIVASYNKYQSFLRLRSDFAARGLPTPIDDPRYDVAYNQTVKEKVTTNTRSIASTPSTTTNTGKIEDNKSLYRNENPETKKVYITNDYSSKAKRVSIAPACSEASEACTPKGTKFFTKTCWGGADPGSGWKAFVYSGQYVKYTNENCSPNQTVDAN